MVVFQFLFSRIVFVQVEVLKIHHCVVGDFDHYGIYLVVGILNSVVVVQVILRFFREIDQVRLQEIAVRCLVAVDNEFSYLDMDYFRAEEIENLEGLNLLCSYICC
jgi:uncharacterized membrane protein